MCVITYPCHNLRWIMLFNIQQDNIGSGNGVSPDGTKPLPEPTLTYHQRGHLTFIPGYCVVEFSRHQYSMCMTIYTLEIAATSPRGQWVTMMTSSSGNIFRVTGPLWGDQPVPSGFPSQRPVTRSRDVFLDLQTNKRLSKQSRHQWSETPLCSLWRHCNDKGPR